jgi:hypothetical protein
MCPRHLAVLGRGVLYVVHSCLLQLNALGAPTPPDTVDRPSHHEEEIVLTFSLKLQVAVDGFQHPVD